MVHSFGMRYAESFSESGSQVAVDTTTFGGRFAVYILGAAAQIIIARALGPAGIGLFTLALTVAIGLTALVHLDLSSSVTDFTQCGDVERKALAGNSLFLAIIGGAAVAVAGFILIIRLRDLYFPVLNDRLWGMALVAVTPLLLSGFSRGLWTKPAWIRRLELPLILKEAVLLAGVVVLARAGLLSVDAAVAIWVLACVIGAVLHFGFVWWRAGWGISVNPLTMKNTAPSGIRSYADNLLTFLLLRSDIFLVAYFLTLRELGQYGIAVLIATVLWDLPTAVAGSRTPPVPGRGDLRDYRWRALLSRFCFTILLAGALFLAAGGWSLIRLLLGDLFKAAYPALVLLIPGRVFYGMACAIYRNRAGGAAPVSERVITTLAFVINVAANLVLIPRYGIVGAAVSSSVANIFAGLMLLHFYVRESGSPVGDMLIIRRGDLRELFRSGRRW